MDASRRTGVGSRSSGVPNFSIGPTYVITNNRLLTLSEVLTIYARRWRIENKLAELVNFFNINALSSPLMVRIHFDLLLSVVASFLYSRLARDLPRFEKNLRKAGLTPQNISR